MRVLLLPIDKAGCGYHRMTEPARAVAEAFSDEVEVDVRYQMDVTLRRNRIVEVDTHGADVVVLQRPEQSEYLGYLRQAQKQGVAVVVEIDDLLHEVPRGHLGWNAVHREGVARFVAECCREADLVTVTTPTLAAEYGRHGRVAIVPNAVPRRFAELPPAYERDSQMVGIGWTGAVSTHPFDLMELGPAFATAMERLGNRAKFVVWSARNVFRQTGVTPHVIPWQDSVDDFLGLLGSVLDVGLAPLRDDRFNQGKSWLKPIEYAARGVLPIYSRVGKYAQLGFGVAATRPRDWAKWVLRAVEDVDWRREQAAVAREYVLDRHLTEHTAERWMAAWRKAADVRVAA